MTTGTSIFSELKQIKQLLSLQKDVLTLEEFCVYAGISKNQAYHLTSTRKIPFYRPFGKMIYFRKEEVIDFLTNNSVGGSKINNQKVNQKILKKIL